MTEIIRNPKRMIYTSSYDRGLIYLLNQWPLIRKGCPTAELHIFYGWNIYDIIHGNNPARARWKAQVQTMMKQDGITEYGRVGHEQLKEEFMKSGIWAYPTNFTEISCISAMKAQVYGAIPLVTNFAALKETVKNGLKIDVDIQTSTGQKTYVEELVKLLNDEKRQEEIRIPMIQYAKENFGWSKVAQKWDTLFKTNLHK